MAKTTTNDMRVIDGWADGITAKREPSEIASITLFTDKRFDELIQASIVIGDKAMPMSQVEAMLRDIISATQIATDGQYGVNITKGIAAKYGITL